MLGSFGSVFAQAPSPTAGAGDSSAPSSTTAQAGPDSAGGSSTIGKYQNQDLAPLPPSSVISNGVVSSGYVLGPGDILDIDVDPQTKYGLDQASVEQDGTIDYPRLGTLTVAGETLEQFRDQIAADLSKYCINPDVSVHVVALKPEVIYITGGVKVPQILDLRAAPNVAKAVTLSGGVLDTNELAHITVFRNNTAIPANVYGLLVNGVDTGENVNLLPGDLVVVPMNTAKFAVVGAVTTPGIYPLTTSGGNEGQTHLADALATAGGALRSGAGIKTVDVVRLQPDGSTKSVVYNFGRYLKNGDASQNPLIVDKDLIFVPNTHAAPNTSDALGYVSFLAVLHGL